MADVELISDVCLKIIEPLQNTLKELVNASKEDLRAFLAKIETNFESIADGFKLELESRDTKILNLEEEIVTLKESVENNKNDYKNIIERLDQLENDAAIDVHRTSFAASNLDSLPNTENESVTPEIVNDQDHELLNDDDESIEQKEALDFVCLGDSIVRWLDLDKIKPGSINKKFCLPGAQIEDIRDALLEINDNFEVRNLYLHVGSNEIPQKSPFEVAKELTNLLTEIKVFMPLTKVYVSTILPKIDSSYIDGINQLNFLLCSSCNILGFVLVQHQAFCNRGIINSNLFAYDQIHLNRSGIAQLARDIKALARSFR